MDGHDVLVVKIKHCGKLACDDCNPFLTARRGYRLYQQLGELEQDKVWFGEIPDDYKDRIRAAKYRYNQQNKEPAQTATGMYYNTEALGIISTINLLPAVPDAMMEMGKSEAAEQWIELGLEYKLSRTRSDWDLTAPSSVEWVVDGTRENLRVALHNAGLLPGDKIENLHETQAKLFRLLADARENEGRGDGMYD
jgi:hypothetical protein